MKLFGLLIASALILAASSPAADSSRAASASHELSLPVPPVFAGVRDLRGLPVNPLLDEKAKAVVLVFASNDCPVSNRYAPEMGRIHKRFAAVGVQFWLVHADPDETPADIEKHLKDYHYSFGAIRDTRHELVKLSQARTTPEAAVFLPGGKLIYHGRIDDRYADLGKERSKATRHDLIEVLELIAGGKTPTFNATRAIGCSIPSLDDPK